MNTPLALQCYNLLLGLYPASFRATFGSEMGEVFSLGLDEAAQRGGWTLIAFWLHEILTLVPAALAEPVGGIRRVRPPLRFSRDCTPDDRV